MQTEEQQAKKFSIGSIFGTAIGISAKVWSVLAHALGTTVLFLVFIALLSSGSQTSSSVSALSKKTLREGSEDVIAAVYLTGVVTEGESQPFGGDAVIASTNIIEILEGLKYEEEVKAVVLHINSPGGSAVASDEIFAKVRELREVKPVVARLGDVAASGGYYIAAGADKIIANQATLTGSIGVITQIPNVSGLFDKIGVEIQTVKTGEFKDIGSSDRSLSDAERAIFQSAITDAFDQFIQAIVTGRSMPEATVRELADGRFYSGKQAKAVGLVDELGTSDAAYELAASLAQIEEYSVVEYSQGGFFSSLLNARMQGGLYALMSNFVAGQLHSVSGESGMLYRAPDVLSN